MNYMQSLKRKTVILGLIIILLSVIAYSIGTGDIEISLNEIINTLIGKGTPIQNLVVFELRLPRIIVSVLVGIGMAIAGATLQGLTGNDLADPGILGVSSGAGFFVLIYIAIFSTTSSISAVLLPILAFLGGMGAAIIIYLLIYKKGKNISSTRLLLTGVAVNTGINAATLFITLTLNRQQYEFTQLWTAGSIWGDEWRYIVVLLPWVLAFSALIFYKSRIIDALNLGQEMAIGLGVNINKEFIVISIAAVALASGSVAIGGSILFIGLIAPHLARKLVGANNKILIPTSGLVGGIFLLMSDTIGRIIMSSTEIPAGIVVSIIGAPYFIYLLYKSK
ncbi:FecCD family ABC transporter permease [Metaclostridioides mangenotii]|uniref:FecCD family ABC transporter permease n=1 Tax=Metaclostridioides mangenotii TaxID=1540 RepID=UPI0026E9DE6E|nr:iron ABC transporter permease [Clostridioides mangenotii]